MARHPHLLPFDPSRPFRTRDAISTGVSAERLRRSDLISPVPGVRVSAASPSDLPGLLAAAALRLPPGAVFSHSTAARLLGLPLPAELESEQRLHVTVPAPRRAMDAQNFAGHSARLAPADLRPHLGLPSTAPARTWRDLATMLEVPDLVAAGDALIQRRTWPVLASVNDLEEVVENTPARARGARRLREALPLLDGRSESRKESQLRVEMVRAGIEGLRSNAKIFDRRGFEIGRFDLVDVDAMTATDYEGDQHRTDRVQWYRDVERQRRLQEEGWHLVRVTADDDLRVMARSIAQGRAARRGLGLTRRPLVL